MAQRSGAFANLLAPGFRRIAFDAYKEEPQIHQAVFKVATTKRAYEDHLQISGVGALQSLPEGVAVTYQDPKQGTTKRFTLAVYGLGYRVTDYMHRHDLYSISGPRMARYIGRGGRYTFENTVWGVFNDAFAGATYTGFDALPLCSTAHTRLLAGTISNRLATDTALSVTGVQSALQLFELFESEEGLPISMTPKNLVVPIQKQWVAMEIVRSTYKPYTGDNEVNVLTDFGLKPVVSRYITSTTAWWITATPADTGLQVYWGLKPTFDSGDDYDTGDAKYKLREEFTVGFDDWRGVVGTAGA